MNISIKKIIFLFLIIISIAFIIYGIHIDDLLVIYNKAKAICLECIGIG